MADEKTLSDYLGYKVRIGNPDNIHDAKRHLKELFKKAGKEYYTPISRELAERADINKIIKKSQSFKEFFNVIKDC